MKSFTMIQAIINSLPNGFYDNWTHDFHSVYVFEFRAFITSGPDWTIGIPDWALDAKKKASEYTEEVSECKSRAMEYENIAHTALIAGDFKLAYDNICKACDEEMTFGDCQSYATTRDMLESVVIVKMTLGEVDSNFESDDPARWINGFVTIENIEGEELFSSESGGGWILSAKAASEENNRNGCSNPDVYWPNSVDAGDFMPYEGYDNGDVDCISEELKCGFNETCFILQNLSKAAYENDDDTAQMIFMTGDYDDFDWIDG